MSDTNYPGIDYGLGKTNIDKNSGLRCGVIAQNSVNPEAVHYIYHGPHTRDMAWESALNEAMILLEHALRCGTDPDVVVKDEIAGAISDYVRKDYMEDRLEDLCALAGPESDLEKAWAIVEQDFDRCGDCEIDPRYEHDGYVIMRCLDVNLMVLQSPYYTFAQYCSPCVPGAGDLDNPCPGGARAYCLDKEWFEEEKCPYPYWSVQTGEQAYQPQHEKPQP